MIKMPYEDILAKISEKSGKARDELESMVREKMDQLSGLISKEGAAHIIANELGIKLFDFSEKLKVKELLEGMRDITVVGKAVQVYEVREFSTGTRQGKVGSFLLGDETGVIRVVLWNEQADALKNIQEGAVVRIRNAFVKNNQGRLEMHLNERSSVEVNPEGEAVGDVSFGAREEAKRKRISELEENDRNVSVVGAVVQVFEPRFFEVCPECGKRVHPQGERFVCEAHGEVRPATAYVLNVFLDDGTDNIRVVCFRRTAEELLGMSEEEFLAMKDNPASFEAAKKDVLGHIVLVRGRVSKNQMFERLELISDRIDRNVDPEKEMAYLEKEIKKAEEAAQTTTTP